MKQWPKLLLAAVMIGAIVYLCRSHLGRLDLLLQVKPVWVAITLAIFVLTRMLDGVVFHLALGHLGVSMGYYESFMIYTIMSYTNMLVPHAGLGAPALYLKSKYQLNYSAFAALLIPTIIIQMACVGLVGLGFLGWRAFTSGLEGAWPLWTAFAAVTGISVIVLLLPTRVPSSWSGRVGNFLRNFGSSWSSMRQRPRLIALITAVQLAAIFLRAVRLDAAFAALGVHASFSGVMVAMVAAQIMFLVSITPGALGLREAAITYVYAVLIGTPEIAVNAALLDRMTLMLGTIVIAQVGLWQFVRPVLGRTRNLPLPAGPNR
ncbi:MAG: lysylphosphatidylglycerol synthase transmembrane domain-containing protein [Phycisphaerae bacterium]|jgi:uncharacterized membrane protein YbhN (UPF0104 family)